MLTKVETLRQFSFGRYVEDLVRVFAWDARIYRVVFAGGLVLGFLLGVYLAGFVATIVWAATR